MERKIISQSSLREFAHDGDDLDKYYLPARGLILPGDIHLLPENDLLINYKNQLNGILSSINLPQRKTIFIPDSDYLLDLAILQHISLLKNNLNWENVYSVYPYATTEETLQWINKLQNEKFNIYPAIPKKTYFEDLYHPAHRGGWGRWVKQPDIASFAEENNLPYPTSWIGQGLDQVIEAYQRVCQDSKQTEAFFKPIFSAGGFTLAKISSKEELIQHYEKLKEQSALNFDGQEIPVEVQVFLPNIEELYSFQYTNDRLLTPRGLSKQIIKNNQWQGNYFNGFSIPEAIITIWEKFKNGYQTYLDNSNFGWGGVDLAKTHNNQWTILEHNGLRITGAHPAISLAQQLEVIEQPFMTLKSPGDVNSDLITIWTVLKQNKLAFDSSTKKGIFPIVWFPGSGMLFSTGDKPYQQLETAYNLFAKENYILTC